MEFINTIAVGIVIGIAALVLNSAYPSKPFMLLADDAQVEESFMNESNNQSEVKQDKTDKPSQSRRKDIPLGKLRQMEKEMATESAWQYAVVLLPWVVTIAIVLAVLHVVNISSKGELGRIAGDYIWSKKSEL
jgi:hypothetical protein